MLRFRVTLCCCSTGMAQTMRGANKPGITAEKYSSDKSFKILGLPRVV